VVLLVIGVVCIAIEPIVTGILQNLGVLVSDVQQGWWVVASTILGGRVAAVGQCLVALGLSALVFAHFLAKALATASKDQES